MKNDDQTPTGRFVYIFQTLILSQMAVELETISSMIGHPPDAVMLAWLSGQVEVGFRSGNVCLLRRSKPGASQVKQSWRISLRSLTSTCILVHFTKASFG